MVRKKRLWIDSKFLINICFAYIASKRYDPIHPMYKSDCEALLNRTFDEHYTLCMNPGITISNTHLVKDNSISKSCYDSGSPIVWRQVRNGTDNAEYLVHMYSHGGCDLNTPRVVTRVAAYIEWFK